MSEKFFNYLQDELGLDWAEIKLLEKHIYKPLKKSIRINTNKIFVTDFKKLVEPIGWILTPTNLGKNTMYIDRTKDLDIPLGSTVYHQAGLFYIQELSASSPAYYLSDDEIDRGDYLILDMSSSPGGKTTQLSEYYPSSFIIANDLNKSRLKQLFTNLERIGTLNTGVTNYDGRFFQNSGELFDKILLDAPCSGEGTCYKGTDAIKYWNIKNIKKIAKIQTQLLETAINILKPGGELVYSTCTLNSLENEQVVESMLEKYNGSIELIPIDTYNKYRRFWPHIDKTGGFFVAKIKKLKSTNDNIILKNEKPILDRLSKKYEKQIVEFLSNFGVDIPKNCSFYVSNDDVYMTSKPVGELLQTFFFYRVGVPIGSIVNGVFEPGFLVGSLFEYKNNIYEPSSDELKEFMRGKDIKVDKNLKDRYVCIKYRGVNYGISRVVSGMIKNNIPSKFIVK